jgi:PilZ domain
MEQAKHYHRSLYRLPVTYPAMYCVMSVVVGEGTITNLSPLGCMIETNQPLPEDKDISLRLLLPDQQESLPIEVAHIQWTDRNRAGIEFFQVDTAATLRLHDFIWERTVQRFHAIQEDRMAS